MTRSSVSSISGDTAYAHDSVMYTYAYLCTQANKYGIITLCMYSTFPVYLCLRLGYGALYSERR